MPSRSTRLAATLLAFAALGAGFAACAGADGAAGPAPRGSQLVTTEGSGTATAGSHAVRGVVVGVDSARGGEAYAPVAGASVRVVLLTRAPAPPGTDTAAVAATRTEVGTVVTDAVGAFRLAAAEGYYALEVTPPAGSPYRGGTAYSVALAASDPGRAMVYLYPR